MVDKNAKNDFDICPDCGNRSKKEGCIICFFCHEKWEKKLKRSARALIDGDSKSITAVPDIFQHVLDKSEHVLNAQRNRLKEAEGQKLAEEERIHDSVANAISERLLEVGATNPGSEVVRTAVSIQVKAVQKMDERYNTAYGRAYGLRKGLDNLLALIEEVKEKRKRYLLEQAGAPESEAPEPEVIKLKVRKKAETSDEEQTATATA